MAVDMDLGKDVRYDSPFVYDKRRSLRSHKLPAIKVFLFPDTIGLDDFLLAITEKWKWKRVLLCKLLM